MCSFFLLLLKDIWNFIHFKGSGKECALSRLHWQLWDIFQKILSWFPTIQQPIIYFSVHLICNFLKNGEKYNLNNWFIDRKISIIMPTCDNVFVDIILHIRFLVPSMNIEQWLQQKGWFLQLIFYSQSNCLYFEAGFCSQGWKSSRCFCSFTAIRAIRVNIYPVHTTFFVFKRQRAFV